MKRISGFLIFALASLTLLSGCAEKVKVAKPGSSGKTLELMVVAKNSTFNGPAHRALDSIFYAEQDGLNQPESRFDVVHITPSDFEDNTMFQAHRNILILDVNPHNINKIYRDCDKWAQPQVVVRITATDDHALDSMLMARSERLLREFYGQEYRRMDKIFSATPNPKIISYVEQKYGLHLSVPQEFAIAKQLTESDFTWLIKRTKDFDLHIYIYKQPYKDSNDLNEATILNNLDTIMRRYVPGPSEGSYPGLERRRDFYSRFVRVGSVDAIEIRGLWRTFNDFMGGPFVSYTFPSPDCKTLYTIMGSVYSPSQRSKMVMKRDLLMQVDGICHSVRYDWQM